MSAKRQFECEVCHAIRGEDEPWLLVPDETWGPALHVLPWDDQVAGEEGIYHVCGPQHAKDFVNYFLTSGYLVGGDGITWSTAKRASAVRDWQITPRAPHVYTERFPAMLDDSDPDTLLAMLDMLEILGDSAEEDSLCEAFDA
jgi:hypothetical protein